MTKKLFEANSTVYKMTIETQKVSNVIGISELMPSGADPPSYHDKSASVANIPKRMSEAIFPMSVVPINHVGFLKKKGHYFAAETSFLCAQLNLSFVTGEKGDFNSRQDN